MTEGCNCGSDDFIRTDGTSAQTSARRINGKQCAKILEPRRRPCYSRIRTLMWSILMWLQYMLIVYFSHVCHMMCIGHWKDLVKFGRSIIDSCTFLRLTRLLSVVDVCRQLLSLVVCQIVCHSLKRLHSTCLHSCSPFVIKLEGHVVFV